MFKDVCLSICKVSRPFKPNVLDTNIIEGDRMDKIAANL